MNRAGLPISLITDFWATGLFAAAPRKLRQRFHPEIESREVVHFNFKSFAFEVQSRVRGPVTWQHTLLRNQQFEKMAASALETTLAKTKARPTIFAFSYAALEIFKVAKKFGCKTVMGQIDPGPREEELVADLCVRSGYKPIAMLPETYWDHWRDECKLADFIVVNSNWSRECLVEQGIEASKLKIIELAFDSARIAPIPRTYPSTFNSQRPLKVLFLGQVIVRKGIVELIEAINLMTDAPVQWTIVGHGDTYLIEKLQKIENVIFAGSVSREQTEVYYSESDLFILPTHSDGFAITQLEAASFGLPIIASRFCGQVVDDHDNGLLLNEVTASEIVEKIQYCLNNPRSIESMSISQSNKPKRTMTSLSKDLLQLNQDVSNVVV